MACVLLISIIRVWQFNGGVLSVKSTHLRVINVVGYQSNISGSFDVYLPVNINQKGAASFPLSLLLFVPLLLLRCCTSSLAGFCPCYLDIR